MALPVSVCLGESGLAVALLLVLLSDAGRASVALHGPANASLVGIADAPADFGPPVPEASITGRLLVGSEYNNTYGCDYWPSIHVARWVAFVKRGGPGYCSKFDIKVRRPAPRWR